MRCPECGRTNPPSEDRVRCGCRKCCYVFPQDNKFRGVQIIGRICSRCNGTGKDPSSDEHIDVECLVCNGAGRFTQKGEPDYKYYPPGWDKSTGQKFGELVAGEEGSNREKL